MDNRMFILYNDQNYLSETYGSGSLYYDVKAAWINFSLDNPFLSLILTAGTGSGKRGNFF